ncbi:MAG: SH3 domain-containing protein [Sedimentisphaerales bacterium]|nr:SH3 domain-containing protein [Sedimentisphaerales bacterium]
MRYHASLFILISIVGMVSVSFAQGAAGMSGSSASPTPSMTVPGSAAYPYDAEITGDNVNVRSGPGTAYYECGKLYKGDKVKIFGDLDGVWSKIQPPAGSFSWISAQYIKTDSADPTIGVITGDEVRVWAGSEQYRPERSTSLQGKLNKGDRVKLLGDPILPVNNYYKIAVPALPDAYYWISTQFTKPIAIETTVVKPAVSSNTGAVSPAADNVAANMANITDANAAAIEVTPHEPTPLEKYYELQKQMEAERVKPFTEQNYSTIKESLLEIVNNPDAGKASIFAQSVIDRIGGIELALGVEDVIKQQNEQLKETKDKIVKAHAKKLEEVTDFGRYAVIGKLQDFLTLGTGNYRIVDQSDQTVCYAVPSQDISGQDLSGLIGKKVGLVGTIEPHTQTSGAMVRFSEVVSLE